MSVSVALGKLSALTYTQAHARTHIVEQWQWTSMAYGAKCFISGLFINRCFVTFFAAHVSLPLPTEMLAHALPAHHQRGSCWVHCNYMSRVSSSWLRCCNWQTLPLGLAETSFRLCALRWYKMKSNYECQTHIFNYFKTTNVMAHIWSARCCRVSGLGARRGGILQPIISRCDEHIHSGAVVVCSCLFGTYRHNFATLLSFLAFLLSWALRRFVFHCPFWYCCSSGIF